MLNSISQHSHDIKIISKKELVKDEQLKLLFKDKLKELAISFLSDAKKNITALYEVLHNKGANYKKEHRLYIFLPSDQIKKQDAKNLIYVKSPYKFSKDELETLDIYVHFAQLLNASSE